ncbi:MAG: ATP-dependent DNA helicase PcrA [Mycoplasmataceae bacterium]|nr:MAG: ATP-dependent DNA helicase PcrA [Mycoplasmataceae bacterium]
MEFLQELNERQKEAVYKEHPRICVIAGPGCGKTKTLVSRLIYLLSSQKAQPQNILVLTFAKKAIKEIKTRVFAHITDIPRKNLHIYNFHSFCFHVLNKHSHLLGFPDSKFPVYDRYEQETIIRKILLQNDHSAEKKEISTILSYISGWKNGKLDNDSLHFDELTKERYQIYQKYEEYLKNSKALDFNDLLIYTILLFTNHPEIRAEYQAQFTHILLDEFQDINSVQWEVIKLVIGAEQNVFLVGDPNQAIYGFQGATPELISSFTKDKEWKTIYLNINYRSTSSIISLSNSFVQKNQHLLVNNLLNSSKDEGLKVNFLNGLSIRSIVRHIRWLLVREKIQFSDIVVLYRNNYLSTRIEQELVTQRVPYEILGSFKFIEREEIKDTISFLKTIFYQDNISLLRTLSLQEKIGIRTIDKIEQVSEKEKVSAYQYLNNFSNYIESNEEKWPTGQIEKITSFISKINKWKYKLTEKITLSTFLLSVLNDFNYWEHLKTRVNFSERERNVQQFFNVIQNWENKRKKEYSNLGELLNSFLQWIIVAFEDKKLIKTRNNLILSSIHQAKGLEFEVVFFVYLDQGTIPYKEAQDTIEEKRLFYVGITRAKRLLYLVSSQELYSPFLNEVDEKYLEKK